MTEISHQIANEAIKRYKEYYPEGNDWGDAMYEYHNMDYEQSQNVLEYLTSNGILVPWKNTDKLMLSSIGIDIMERFDGDIIKYLEHKKAMKRKAEAEHELEMNVHRSTLRSNRIQFWATIVNIIIGIVNIVCAILNYINQIS